MSIPEKILQAGCDAYCAKFLNGLGSLGDGIEAAYLAIHHHDDWVRAGPPAWTGEGLPPVGMFCEVVSPGYRNDRFERFIGQAVTVIAHDVIDDDPVAVFRMPVDGQVDEQDYHALVAKCFRPIRTPEQTAEDEREAGINAIHSMLDNCIRDLRGDAEALWDAGYRKQPAP